MKHHHWALTVAIVAVLALSLLWICANAKAASSDELTKAQASCERWELAFVKHWGRWALAKACLQDKRVVRITAPAVEPDETDPVVWRVAARWFRTRAARYRRLSPALVGRIVRPGTRRLAAWRPCAEWFEAHNPASENTAADARDVLRLLRRVHGPRPRLRHPLRTMRALDGWWFSTHERNPYEPVVVSAPARTREVTR